MALLAIKNDTKFGVGDVVNVHQKIIELVKGEEKSRIQVFQGRVIKIKGREHGKTFTVRRIGAQKIGVELIMPLNSPLLEKVEVVREGVKGARHAKLYYTRDKSKKEIESIYTRAKRREAPSVELKKKKAPKKKVASKKVAKKAKKS